MTFWPIPINLDTFQSTASRGKSAECFVSGGEGAFSSHISHMFWPQKDIVRQFINVLYQNLGKLIWNTRINNLLIKEKERKKTDPRCNQNIENYIPDISPCTVIDIYINSKKMSWNNPISITFYQQHCKMSLKSCKHLLLKKNSTRVVFPLIALKASSVLSVLRPLQCTPPHPLVSPKARVSMDSRIMQNYRGNKVAITTILYSITVCSMGHSGPRAAIKI